jgi:apolipoprotein D and lipocalin family protein
MKLFARLAATTATVAALTGCSTHPPMPTVDRVDLDRFMGDWYVVANIPTFLERGAHNAVERYALNPDGTVATTFTFREGGFDGEVKTYHPTGYIQDTETNALWGMQFVWPVKADYRIVYLDEDYTRTVIGRQARDYVWVMARAPDLSEAEYAEITEIIGELGYDTSKLERVPQDWSDAEEQTP